MMTVPTFSRRGTARGYRDGSDRQVVYVDALHPTTAADAPLRWQTLPNGEAAMAVEVRFGADERSVQPFAVDNLRPQPIPWQVSPVFAWIADGAGVQFLARGQTSGYGAHNAVLSATTGRQHEGAAVVIAAELQTVGQLVGARLEGRGDAAAARAALRYAPVGRAAGWELTLGEALEHWLRELLNQRILTLRAEAFDLTLDGVEDLRGLALAEWAYRMMRAWYPGFASLAQPAGLAGTPAERKLDLTIDWHPGAVIPVRAVRPLR